MGNSKSREPSAAAVYTAPTRSSKPARSADASARAASDPALRFASLSDNNSGRVMAPIIVAAARGDLNAIRSLLSGDGGASNASTLLLETGAKRRVVLSHAAESGSAACVAELIRHGAAVDARDRAWRTPLTYASSAAVTTELLKHGAMVDALDVMDRTPLFHAAEANRVDVVAALIQHGASLDKQDKERKTVLIKAAEQGRTEIVIALLEAGADVNIRREDGRSALIQAARGGHLEVAAELIKYGAAVNKGGFRGRNALSYAARFGNLAVVQELLKQHAKVDGKDDDGRSALSHAAETDKLAVVQELLKHGAEVDAKGKSGTTALSYASSRGSACAVLELLKHRADVNSADKLGRTPLMIASSSGHGSTVFELLIEHGATINAKDKHGRAALSHAAEVGDFRIVARLLRLGAAVNERDNKGRSAISYAAQWSNYHVVGELIKYGAIAGKKDNNGKPPIWYAMSRSSADVMIKLLRLSPASPDDVVKCFVAAVKGKTDELKNYVANGIPVDTRASDGRTMLFYAAERGSAEVVEFLLASGASVKLRASDPSRPSRSGDTPLTLAGSDGHMKIFQTLLDAGASVNARGDDGETPLISLARYDYFKGVQQLIALGGSVGYEDVADDEYPLIPGTLETMRAMCGATFEFEIMCCHLVDRLDAVCSELQRRPTSNLQQGGTLVSFTNVCFRFCRLLLDIKKREVPLTRLIASRAISRKIEAFHDELDHFSDMLGTTTPGRVDASWRKQWEDYQMQIPTLLEQTLSSDDAIVDSLGSKKKRTDAALNLQYELVTRSREGNSSARQVLAGVQKRLLRVSETFLAPEVPEWFLSLDDVEFHEWNLVRKPHDYLKWYEGTWRKSSVVIETDEFKRLESDATRWFQLRHPNVVKLLGASLVTSPSFFVYELGADVKFLNEFLDAVDDDADRAVATWKCLYDAARGLQYLHSRGVIHGDLRRENIVVGSDAIVKLGGMRGIRMPGPKWRSPELRFDMTRVSTKSDIFALGMCIWEALVREAPEPKRGSVPQRPKAMGDAEWDLISKMCTYAPSDRIDIAFVVSQLKQFVLNSMKRKQQDRSGDASPSSVFATDQSLDEHVFAELGCATIPSTLSHIRERCAQVSSEEWMADKVRPALDYIFTLLQERGKIPTNVETLQFCDALMNFQRYLRTPVSDKSVFVLARSRQVAELHHVIYAELDRLLDVMRVAEAHPIRAWRHVGSDRVVGDQEGDGQIPGNVDSPDSAASDSVLDSIPHTVSYLHAPNRSSSAVSLHFFDSMSMNHAAWTQDGLAAASVSTKRSPSWYLALRDVIFSEANKIGQGSFGAVYKGSWLDTPVVVKFMGYEEDAGTISTDLLLHEVRVWHRLSHPHVLKLYGANHEAKRYFVCEFAGGGELLTYLKRPGNEHTLWQKMYEAALGLEYMHETHNVAHNDLKCDNIMVGSDGKAKLIDFGLSALLNEAEVQIDVKRMGAVHWRSPEYLSGGRPSFESDVYSFAMCLIEVVSGDIPWGRNMIEPAVRNKVRHGFLPAVPAAMNDKQRNLIDLMTKREPSERVKMSFVVDKLREIAQDEQDAASQRAP